MEERVRDGLIPHQSQKLTTFPHPHQKSVASSDSLLTKFLFPPHKTLSRLLLLIEMEHYLKLLKRALKF